MADWKPKAQTFLTKLLLGFALVSIGFAAGKHAAKTGGNAEPVADVTDGSGNTRQSAVVVYYMHATFRCVTCNTIERMTRELLNAEFTHETEAGTVRMEEVDFQENGTLAKRYEVVASCVVVTQQSHGKEVAYRRLDEVWTLMKDPPAFNRYVGDVIRGYLTDEETQ